MKIASFFSGAGGLDLGFKQAGFDIVFANEFDKDIWATYEHNHPETTLDKRSITLLNAADFDIAQDRKRVIFIGFRTDLNIQYSFPEPTNNTRRLEDIIQDLEHNVVPAINKSKPNPKVAVANHEYMTGGFSSMYMSRNRVRGWDEPSFTIQAGGRHAPIHPSAPKMVKLEQDKFMFSPCGEYRRLSVRECARIQSFPDNFIFKYSDVNHGYKMIGNAVNVDFAKILAESIMHALNQAKSVLKAS